MALLPAACTALALTQTTLKGFFRAIILACVTAAGAGAQTLIIAGPGGQVVELSRDGGFLLRLPGRPPVYGGGHLFANGGQREFWLVDHYFGLMAHAEAVLDGGSGGPGRGRLEFYGPWGYVAFSGAAWEVPDPDRGEEESRPPDDAVSAPADLDGGIRAVPGAFRFGAAHRPRRGAVRLTAVDLRGRTP
ncbi:MAG TPA: hypothetical protein VFC61_11115 [Blastocatellia bacterium]|nr:hypothetical protein [Blastocatellia bacterium]